MFGQIIGGYVGAVTIEGTSGPSFYLIMGGLMMFAMPAFYVMRIPEPVDS